MGDTFSNIQGSTIVNRSLVTGAIGAAERVSGPDSAEALRRLAAVVEQSGDVAAGRYLDAFNVELAKPEPSKPLLRRAWECVRGAIKMAPEVIELIDGVEKILE
jgi:hypothetical protein